MLDIPKIIKNPFQYFIQHHILMNWTNLSKCILILGLTIFEHFLWIFWKLYIIYSPELWVWADLNLLKLQIRLNIIALLAISLLIACCVWLRKKLWAEKIIPYVIVTSFSLIFIRDAYLIGILSPATLCIFVCISGVGILLFDRKILYTSVFVAVAVFIYLGVLTLNGQLEYAPLFSEALKNSNPPINPFWVWSMLYFIIPLLLTCLILCEIMLIQWRNREFMIQKLSQTDPLTDLWNRRFFNEQVQSLQRLNRPFAIVILDLDHFKTINDQYGHSIGDDTLKAVSKTLVKYVPQQDIVARYGGEEFIIAIDNKDQAIKIAERCRQAIEQLEIKVSDTLNVGITASFGIAFSSTEIGLEQAIRQADDALYIAKQRGRNQVQVFHNPS